MNLQPFTLLLLHTLDQLVEKDVGHVFTDPVNPEEVGRVGKVLPLCGDSGWMRTVVWSYSTLFALNAMMRNCARFATCRQHFTRQFITTFDTEVGMPSYADAFGQSHRKWDIDTIFL